MTKIMRSALPFFGALLALVLFLLFPARYAESVKEGISLWATSVLPSTLPLLLLVSLLTSNRLFGGAERALSPLAGKCFRLSGAGGCAAIAGALSGYPVGARTVLDLAQTNRLSKEETFRTAAIATTSGPAFLVGAVGCGMYADGRVGWLLYLSHLSGVWIAAFLLSLKGEKPKGLLPRKGREVPFGELLKSSVLSVLTVGGAIAVFYAFGQMVCDFCDFFALPRELSDVLSGLLEMTTGCARMAAAPSRAGFALSAFFVTFGGLCVSAQQLAFLVPAGVRPLPFLAVKAFEGLLAAGICLALCPLFGL